MIVSICCLEWYLSIVELLSKFMVPDASVIDAVCLRG